jgi:hypothetical protein
LEIMMAKLVAADRVRMVLCRAFAAVTLLAAMPQPGPAAAQAAAAAATPDFSGRWKLPGNAFDFAAPPAGMTPGPLVNTSGNRLVPIANHDSPLLKPWAAAEVKKHGDLLQAGRLAPDAHTSCQPMGVPYVLQVRGNVQFLQTPEAVTIIYMDNNQRRVVQMNAKHSANPKPTWFGESVGHYEGDSLVIDTIGIAVNEVSSIDRFGTPHTPAMHVVERYRVSPDRKQVNVVFTVDDPGTFNTPWHASGRYVTGDDGTDEDVCMENIRQIGSSGIIVVPTAAKPDF